MSKSTPYYSKQFSAKRERHKNFTFLDSTTLRLYSGETNNEEIIENPVVWMRKNIISKSNGKQSYMLISEAKIQDEQLPTFFRLTLDSDESVYMQGSAGFNVDNHLFLSGEEWRKDELLTVRMSIFI